MAPGRSSPSSDRSTTWCCRAKAAIAQAKLRLATEEQEAAVARREWKELGQGEPSPLTLREGGEAVSSAVKVHLQRPLRSLPFLEQLLAGTGR